MPNGSTLWERAVVCRPDQGPSTKLCSRARTAWIGAAGRQEDSAQKLTETMGVREAVGPRRAGGRPGKGQGQCREASSVARLKLPRRVSHSARLPQKTREWGGGRV